MDEAITTFFEERKEGWSKKNISSSLTDEEVRNRHAECDAVFSLQNWLPNAARRAGQISISTHPCTFSHPSARKNKNGYVSSIIAKSESSNDGFLRSGNVSVEADALGNAAALDVYKFLMLRMADGLTLLEHLEQDSALAVGLLQSASADEATDYATLKEGFLAMTAASADVVTSSKIKQVYFPFTSQEREEEEYHQLSLLTASGIVFELRKRLDNMRFGDEIRLAREQRKANIEHPEHQEVINLTTIGYGGTKPQNISVLNNQNGGKAHLFMSMPPPLQKRDVHFPTNDFFSQVARYSHCKAQFQALHKLYLLPNEHFNNMATRAKRDQLYQSVIDYIVDKMVEVRAVAEQQYFFESNKLPAAQKTWLANDTQESRLSTDDWLDEICNSITSFLFHGYEKTLGKQAIKFSDAEYKHMCQRVIDNTEILR